MAATRYWVWFSGLRGVSARTKCELIEHFGGPERVYLSTQDELKQVRGITKSEMQDVCAARSLDECERVLERCAALDIGILTLQDAAYPERLRNIYDPPAVLYIKGRLPSIDEEAAIGIVGTRKCTPYGRKMALNLGYEITRGGGYVISGLAEGIDSAGAEGALQAGGGCVGVLGTAIDVVYPYSNKNLFADVQAVGALVSEYPPGTETKASFFPQRNRIISGLSVGVLIIEAPKRSGALITASRALDQGRDVFAVPGNADAPSCEGSNELIKDCAKAVTKGSEILCEYERLFPYKLKSIEKSTIPMSADMQRAIKTRLEKTAAERPAEEFKKVREPKKIIDKETSVEYIDLEEQLSSLTAEQLKIVSVMTQPSMHVDDIADLTKLPVHAILSELTLLEISGYIRPEKGKRFTLNLK